MEEIPLNDDGENTSRNPARYKRLLAEATERATAGLVSCDWDLVDGDDNLQLCVNNETRSIRVIGTLRGTREHWRSRWLSGVSLNYESYVCREEKTQISVFAHMLNTLGTRYRAAGIYHVYDIDSERTTRLIYVTDEEIHTLHTDPMSLAHVDGTLGLWLRASGAHHCEVHLVIWPDFHLSALESLRHCGVWTSQMVMFGKLLKAAILDLQPSEST
jgi:hypothetical protein